MSHVCFKNCVRGATYFSVAPDFLIIHKLYTLLLMPSWISKTLDKVNLASRDCHRQAMFNIILHLLHVRMKVILLDWVIVQFPFQYDHTYYQVSLKYEVFVSWRFKPSHINNWSRVIDWSNVSIALFYKNLLKEKFFVLFRCWHLFFCQRCWRGYF